MTPHLLILPRSSTMILQDLWSSIVSNSPTYPFFCINLRNLTRTLEAGLSMTYLRPFLSALTIDLRASARTLRGRSGRERHSVQSSQGEPARASIRTPPERQRGKGLRRCHPSRARPLPRGPPPVARDPSTTVVALHRRSPRLPRLPRRRVAPHRPLAPPGTSLSREWPPTGGLPLAPPRTSLSREWPPTGGLPLDLLKLEKVA